MGVSNRAAGSVPKASCPSADNHGGVTDLTLRPYEDGDADAVWTLHEWAMRESGTDPTDIPATGDLRSVREAYADGAFLVGTTSGSDTGDGGARSDPDRGGSAPGDADGRPPEARDGRLVAMGGVLPNEAGHPDERTVPGAAELHRMRVAPTHQRRGYGRRLLAALEESARELGHDLLLATTARRQTAAVAFYREAGYEAVGESTEAGYELVHFEKEL